ncbi:uncharacterized [Tachysurus ichikawai]
MLSSSLSPSIIDGFFPLLPIIAQVFPFCPVMAMNGRLTHVTWHLARVRCSLTVELFHFVRTLAVLSCVSCLARAWAPVGIRESAGTRQAFRPTAKQGAVLRWLPGRSPHTYRLPLSPLV